MEKKITASLCLFFLCMLVGCGMKEGKREKVATPEVTVNIGGKSDLDMLPENIQKVITDGDSFIDVEQKKNYMLATYTMLSSEGDLAEVYWGNYIVADIDADGEKELIVHVDRKKNEESVDASVRVLDLQGNTVYCYTYPYRGILNVYKNGVMEGSSGAQDNILYTAKYDGMKYKDIRDAESISTFENETAGVDYYIGKDKVSEGRYYDYIKKYSDENSLMWSEMSLS